MSDLEEVVEQKQTERDRVAGWRLHVLVEAGFPVPVAEALAQSDVDLHRAVELVTRGCEAELAAEILL